MTGPRRLIVTTTRGVRRRIIPGTILIVLHQLAEVAVPVVVGTAIDRGIAHRDPVQLALWLGVLVIVFVVLATSYRLGSLLVLRGVEEAHHDLRVRATARILDPRGFGDRRRPVGELLGIAGSDVEGVSRGVLLFVYPIAELLAVAGAGAVLFAISWPLGLAVIVGGPVFLLLLDGLGRTLRRRTEGEQRVTAEAATLAADAISGLHTLDALGASRRAASRYRAASAAALGAALSARRAEASFVATSNTLTGVFVVGIGLLAATMALQGAMTLGELISVVGIVQIVMGPLEALAVNVGVVWARSTASARRLLSLLTAPAARSVRAVPDDAPGATTAGADPLVVSGVAGAHLRDVSFAVAPGEIVGVVAPPDEARELVEMLGGRIRPRAGSVTAGRDLAHVSPAHVPTLVAAVPHDAHALSGTVLENVVGGIRHRGRAETALTSAAFDDVLAGLPGGIHSPVGPAGRALSGGQRQRLALARAYASQTPVLVLHEPTSSVDAVTELAIAERLRAAAGRRALVVVSTSPQLLSRADRIIVLQGGIVVAEGTHTELREHSPDYARAAS